MIEAQSIRPISVPHSPQQRLMAIAVVAGIHVVVIAAFLFGLNKTYDGSTGSQIIAKWITEKPTEHPPVQAPPITLIQPRGSANPVKPPIVQIDESQDHGPVINTTADGPVGNAGSEQIAARAIAGTHTIPDYPAIESRLGHEGNVLLRLSIDQSGAVADAVVERSSGYDGLDRAAAEWVKAHWRYLPATRGGEAVASITEVTVTIRLTSR